MSARHKKKAMPRSSIPGTARTCRWGILGCGNIADSFARGLLLLPEAELWAAASIRPGASRSFTQKHQGRKSYDRYEDLLNDKEVEVVYVATPHNLHFEQAMSCLNAGKHVLCEKPFTVNAAQAGKLITVARNKGLFLMEAMWTRFLPATRTALDWIRQGAVGEIRSVAAHFGFYTNVGPSHRLLNRNLAGGALLDIGVYPLALANMIYQAEPARMTSSARLGATGVDTQSSYVLEYANGAMAHLWASFESMCPSEAVICGTKGHIRLPKFWQAQEACLAVHEKRPLHRQFRYPSSGLQFEAQEVMSCLAQGLKESPAMPLADTLSVIKQMDRMRASWGLTYPGESL